MYMNILEMFNELYGGNFQKEVFIELKTISYAKQYSLNLFECFSISNLFILLIFYNRITLEGVSA